MVSANRSREIRFLSLSSDLRIALDIFLSRQLAEFLAPSSLIFSPNCSISPPSKLGNCSAGYYHVLPSAPYPCDGFPIFHVHFPKYSSCPSISSRNRSSVDCLSVISICICSAECAATLSSRNWSLVPLVAKSRTL